MIFLDPYHPKIIRAREQHLEKLLPEVLNNINECPNEDLKLFLREKKVIEILIGLPDRLIDHHNDWLNQISNISVVEWRDYIVAKRIMSKNRTEDQSRLVQKYTTLISDLNSIFKYTGGFAKKSKSYSAYDLAKNLNVNTCIYCNRLYTKTVVKPSKVIRPEFDHWFPKSTYPLLALSFYNLIPSCHVCNSSVKSTTEMKLSEHLHPYVPEDINMRFSYRIESLNQYKFSIKRAPFSKEDNTIRAFKIEEIYESHIDEINDLIRLKKLYSIDYLVKLRSLLSNVDSNVSMKELYRLAFGVHYEEKNFIKRPLSKMKKDILKELGIVK